MEENRVLTLEIGWQDVAHDSYGAGGLSWQVLAASLKAIFKYLIVCDGTGTSINNSGLRWIGTKQTEKHGVSWTEWDMWET